MSAGDRISVGVVRRQLPLTAPYGLSFGTVEAFDTLYVIVRGGGRTGLGEITPLPGYNHETVDSALAVLAPLQGDHPVAAVEQAAQRLAATDPFAASGIACAVETWREGLELAFGRPVVGDIPLAVFCPGGTPEQVAANAAERVGRGARTLKMKVGMHAVEADLARVRAAAAAIGEGVEIRLDANQALGHDDALALAKGLEPIAAVSLLEQPFPSADWEGHRQLAAATTVPLMLDEAVWTADDVERSRQVGARLVKLKLCKHPGLAATVALLSVARQSGLGVVFGNGVQTEIGNHLEARAYRAAGLETAAEFNGFDKIARPLFPHALRIADGMFADGGVDAADTLRSLS